MLLNIYLTTVGFSALGHGLIIAGVHNRLRREGYEPKKIKMSIVECAKIIFQYLLLLGIPLLNLSSAIVLLWDDEAVYEEIRKNWKKASKNTNQTINKKLDKKTEKTIDKIGTKENNLHSSISFESLTPEQKKRIISEVLEYVKENESQTSYEETQQNTLTLEKRRKENRPKNTI